MQEPYSINVFEVKINTKILSISIREFIIIHDYSPYIIMNKTTLNEMEKYYIDYFSSIGGIIKYETKEETVPKFEGCKILIDNSLNDGEVLLR
jgi:hypothetical protein